MPRTTGPQRLDRVLRFLIALRDDRLTLPLAEAGFSDDDLAEGWSLLRATSPAKVGDVRSSEANAVRDAFEALEAWVKRHVRLVEMAVKTRFPELHAELYADLPPATGASTILAVIHFLDRVASVAKKPGGKELVGLLEKRGLTSSAIADARASIATAQSAPTAAPAIDYAAAEAAAWRWYVEWSTVARQVVGDGRVLRRLAFGDRHDDG